MAISPNRWQFIALRRGDLLLFALILCALLASLSYYLQLTLRPYNEVMAIIESNGKVVATLNLTTLQEPWQEIYYSGVGEQYNLVEALPGRIRVAAANCPEQVDVRTGWLSRPCQSAICLPHHFVLRLVAAAGTPQEIDTILH